MHAFSFAYLLDRQIGYSPGDRGAFFEAQYNQQEVTACSLPASNFVDNSLSEIAVVGISIVVIIVVAVVIIAVGVVWVDVWSVVTLAAIVDTIIVVGTVVIVWVAAWQIATFLQVGNIQIILVLWWFNLRL